MRYIPNILDKRLQQLYFNRSYFYQVNHLDGSSLDSNISLNNLPAMISYLPRAIQILYLAPFPSSWLSEHSSARSSLMYKILGLEMLFIYVSLVGTICALYIWRKKIEIWVMLSFSLYFGLVYTFAFPNVGALIRYRYAALMLLVALGISAFMYLYSSYRDT